MKALARSFVWWPGIDKDLENVVSSCDSCQRTRHSPPPAPLHPWEFPSAPWERLHADFAGPFLHKMFLIVVDAHTKWLEVIPMSTTTTQTTVEKLRSIFATHGLPRILTTDNSPQFTSAEFQAFMKANGIRHIRSSPYHPATNGLAERAVQSFKEHLKRFRDGSLEEKLAKFLAWYRLTPHSTTGVPPAELLMGRRPRSKLDLLKPSLSDTVRSKVQRQKEHHDARSRARSFKVHDPVYVKDFPDQKVWIPGNIVEAKGPLSYHVELNDGRVVRRHIDAIRSRSIVQSDTATSDSDLEIPYPEAPGMPSSSADGLEQPEQSPDSSPAPPRRTTRERTQPDYYGYNDS